MVDFKTKKDKAYKDEGFYHFICIKIMISLYILKYVEKINYFLKWINIIANILII